MVKEKCKIKYYSDYRLHGMNEDQQTSQTQLAKYIQQYYSVAI